MRRWAVAKFHEVRPFWQPCRVRKIHTSLEFSASDLSQFLGCRQRTALDLMVAHGQRAAPTWIDPALLILQQRGLAHELAYAEALRAQGLRTIDLATLGADDAVHATHEAMRGGADVILQSAFRDGHWFGRPDVLLRSSSASRFGPWSYEIVDTKLAKETRAGTVLQLALYSEMLGAAQSALPEYFHVITPDLETPKQSYRVHDYAAYFRFLRARLDAYTNLPLDVIGGDNYPEPVEHCDVCRWWSECDRRRRADDHLSLVAGISRLQRRELQAAAVVTLAELGQMPLPLSFKPRRGAVETYVRVREQARVQLAGRTQGQPVHELLAVVEGQGLARLPEPSAGDIFLDLEGDPFARDGGREYLFGLVVVRTDGEVTSLAYWASSDSEELAAFEAVVDAIMATWQAHPGMHVYHYAPYEPAALKRLMGRHGTREAEIDRLLRAERFVDLYSVVKQALRASVERYSIKDLEPFYHFKRTVMLADARAGLRRMEHALELGGFAAVPGEVRAVVEGYNRDDCLSAMQLRHWLEQLRAALVASGTEVSRPMPKEGAAPEHLDERERRVRALVAALKADAPTDRHERSEGQQACWLLADLLDWHRREAKAAWWEFYRLCALTDEELLSERAALAGLAFSARVGGTKKSPIDRYSYPKQDTDIGKHAELYLTDGKRFGKVVSIDRAACSLEIKKPGALADLHPSATFSHDNVDVKVLAAALIRLAEDVAAFGVSSGTQYRAARELLLGRPPRLRNGLFSMTEGESPVQFAQRVAVNLDETVLAIQGPPGAGKTYAGAQMICDLVQRGCKVGVTAGSHKVIRKLLDEVANAGASRSLNITCVQKVSDKNDAPSVVKECTDNNEAIQQLVDGDAQVVGGTPWLWARAESSAAVDVLFVDEAGQMSLANVLAASLAARSVVLLGDPQQLEQPQQGSHPEGAEVSALEHILGPHQTVPLDRGIFLPETWRLAPSICTFTSEVFYEGRLQARSGLELQQLTGTGLFDGSGLWVVPVDHNGNQNASSEEVAAIERAVEMLLRPTARWMTAAGASRPITPEQILVVAPYNAQVGLLEERLGSRRVRVGTVDKFQGQEAPVVIYSLTTSSPDEAPRGMEFLYSLNRLNVATSRARCACILVACPRLFEPECKSPRQMQLANALCRYVELAKIVEDLGK
jgi:predicted RecB family nuclease